MLKVKILKSCEKYCFFFSFQERFKHDYKRKWRNFFLLKKTKYKISYFLAAAAFVFFGGLPLPLIFLAGGAVAFLAAGSPFSDATLAGTLALAGEAARFFFAAGGVVFVSWKKQTFFNIFFFK